MFHRKVLRRVFKMSFHVMLGATLIGLSCIASAQELSSSHLFPLLIRISDKAEEGAPVVKRRADSIAEQLGPLLATLEKLPGGVPMPYQLAFAEYSRQLDEVSKDISATDVPAVLQNILEDLKLKNTFVRDGFGFSIRNKFLVQVRVTTVSMNARIVNGYDVTCNPRGLKKKLFGFGKLTSPAEQAIPPGIYTCEISQAGRFIAKKEPIMIGLSGREIEDVEVFVP